VAQSNTTLSSTHKTPHWRMFYCQLRGPDADGGMFKRSDGSRPGPHRSSPPLGYTGLHRGPKSILRTDTNGCRSWWWTGPQRSRSATDNCPTSPALPLQKSSNHSLLSAKATLPPADTSHRPPWRHTERAVGAFASSAIFDPQDLGVNQKQKPDHDRFKQCEMDLMQAMP